MSATQNAAILKYLLDGKRITDLDALELFRCRRLAARIWDLRQPDGGSHPIKREMKKLDSGKSVAEYYYDFGVSVGDAINQSTQGTTDAAQARAA